MACERRCATLLLLALCVTTQPGCMNLRAASSGEIGCPESEVEIYDDTGTGSSRTWTAECRGRIFYCSYHTTGYGADGHEGQYACTESVVESTNNSTIASDQGSRETASSPAKPQANTETRPAAPTEAVGFSLSQSAASAEESCVAAGHHWSANGGAFVCSGTPVSVGNDAKARLAFCHDKLCDLTVFVRLRGEDDNADAQLNSIVDAMRDKYGPPKENERGGTAYCRSQGMVRCTAAGGAFLKQSWEWDTGEKIYLSFKGKRGTSTLAVRYLLHEPSKGSGASAF